MLRGCQRAGTDAAASQVLCFKIAFDGCPVFRPRRADGRGVVDANKAQIGKAMKLLATCLRIPRSNNGRLSRWNSAHWFKVKLLPLVE